MFYQVIAWHDVDGKALRTKRNWTFGEFADDDFTRLVYNGHPFGGMELGRCTYAQLAYMVDEKNGFLVADYTPKRGITWFGGGVDEN